MFSDIIEKINSLEPLIKLTNKPEIESMAKFLYERVSHPDSYLVFLGETSSGKSSVINGLIGKDILPMKANPSTAAITEVMITDSPKDEYFAINANATIERIDKNVFMQLSEKPDDKLKRLRLKTSTNDVFLKNLRIFDTPGYGSIVAEHEEVLKDFLPNSDIVVYTVNYKIGIQDEDYVFLGFLRELIRPDVKIILLINRCPEDITEKSPKIEKIKKFVSDIITLEPAVFIIHNIINDNNDHALPYNSELWKYVAEIVNSSERCKILHEAFNGFVKDLYNDCYNIIEGRYLTAKISNDEFNKVKQIQKDTSKRIYEAIDDLINPTFDQIVKSLPSKFTIVKSNVQNRVNTEIEKQGIMNMEEMIGYTNAHLLPYTIKTETKEVQNYVDVMLQDLNAKVDDYIQKELIKFNNDVTATITSNLDVATSQILSGIIKNVGLNALGGYFAAFGGAGGANAGIANAASHLLKKAGDNIFNHTFSRATHNGLKHVLKKIGATSMKTIGTIFAVIVELGFEIKKLLTWKKSLKKSVSKGLDKWENETVSIVIDDINKLRNENIDTIKDITRNIESSFDQEKPINIDECENNYEFAKQVGKNIF